MIPTPVPGYVAGGNPQTGQVFLGGTNYWIAPQNSTDSIQPFGVLYSRIAQQQFVVPTAGFYRFDMPGAGDNELEFYIGGAQLVAGTNTASMVLWDYGGSTGAIIGSSTFAPMVAYWAPATGAGGTVNGQIMLLTVGVPEPSTYALALAGLSCGGFSIWQRRKRASRSPRPSPPTASDSRSGSHAPRRIQSPSPMRT